MTEYPKALDMEVSRLCNLKCPGCQRGSLTSLAHRRERSFLDKDLLRDFLDKLPRLELVNLLGDGEPLLNPYLTDILAYLNRRDIRTMITTNGTLLTQPIIKEWERLGVSRVYISIDGVTQKTFNKVRPGAFVGEVKDSLNYVGNSNIELVMNCLMYDTCMEELPELAKLALKMKARKINFLHPIFYLHSDIGEELSRAKNNLKNKKILGETMEILWEGKVRWNDTLALVPTFRECIFPSRWPYITFEGDIYACAFMVGEKRTEWYNNQPIEVNTPDYHIGNILKEPFETIWNGEKHTELRRFMKKTEKPIGETISKAALAGIRKEEEGKGIGYCKGCLFRWGCACY